METFAGLVICFFAFLTGSHICPAHAQWHSSLLFVGYSGLNGKVFITTKAAFDLQEGMDQCQFYGMHLVSIDNKEEADLVAYYLNTTTDDPKPTSFWLPATDYATEGQFTWLHNTEPLSYTAWGPGFPSINRTRNCAIVAEDGTWAEEVCSPDYGQVKHHPLCGVPLMKRMGSVQQVIASPQQKEAALPVPLPPAHEVLDVLADARLVPIGGVGTKLYFKDETLEQRKPFGALNFCHSFGMRLVDPVTDEERQFVLDYSRQLADSGEHAADFVTAGTDMLSLSCTRSNTEFRSFYSGVSIPGAGLGHNYRYGCVRVIPSGFMSSDCIGFYSWVMCELDTAKTT